jgi:hypothetical protein
MSQGTPPIMPVPEGDTLAIYPARVKIFSAVAFMKEPSRAFGTPPLLKNPHPVAGATPLSLWERGWG